MTCMGDERLALGAQVRDMERFCKLIEERRLRRVRILGIYDTRELKRLM